VLAARRRSQVELGFLKFSFLLLDFCPLALEIFPRPFFVIK
jgi:hypothetical protein